MRWAVVLLVFCVAGCSVHGLSDEQRDVGMARSALRGGSPQTALQIVAGALAADPDNDSALIVQGEALTALGRYDEAEFSYNNVLSRNAESVPALLGLGRIKLISDPPGAEVILLQASHLDPRNTVVLNNLGIARDLQNHHPEAQEAYRKALGIDPQMNAAMVNLALSMAMGGKAEEGVRLLRPMASKPDASPKMRHDLAAALTMAGHREEAERILSTDLTPDEVRQALDAYGSAKASEVVRP